MMRDASGRLRTNDYVRRKEVIDAIEYINWYHVANGKLIEGANSKSDVPVYKAEDVYKAIDRVEMARDYPAGKWVRTEDGKKYFCNKCGFGALYAGVPETGTPNTFQWTELILSPYCPFCGRRME